MQWHVSLNDPVECSISKAWSAVLCLQIGATTADISANPLRGTLGLTSPAVSANNTLKVRNNYISYFTDSSTYFAWTRLDIYFQLIYSVYSCHHRLVLNCIRCLRKCVIWHKIIDYVTSITYYRSIDNNHLLLKQSL